MQLIKGQHVEQLIQQVQELLVVISCIPEGFQSRHCDDQLPGSKLKGTVDGAVACFKSVVSEWTKQFRKARAVWSDLTEARQQNLVALLLRMYRESKRCQAFQISLTSRSMIL